MMAYLLLCLCAGDLWFCLSNFTDEDCEMMTYTPTRRTFRLKLCARIESAYLAWRIKHAEKEVRQIRDERIAAFWHADRLSHRIDSYEAHITLLAQRLGRARWK